MNESRVWGEFEVLADYGNVKLKKLIVKPSHCLSWQKHSKRNEFWVVQSGFARVVKRYATTTGDRTDVLTAGQTWEIPVGVWHQIINIGSEPLVIIETQWGEACDEDDIERMYQ